MINSVILDREEYDSLVEKLRNYEKERIIIESERKLIISVSGMERGWQFLGYEDGKYGVVINSGKDIPPELVEECKKVFKEELTILNEKVKEYTLLKAEIEILQKQEKK